MGSVSLLLYDAVNARPQAGQVKVQSIGTGSSYSVGAGELLIAVEGSGSRTVTLPAPGDNQGRMIVIKDNIGNAGSGSNGIIVNSSSGNIDGISDTLINVNKGAVMVISNGAQWNIIGKYAP